MKKLIFLCLMIAAASAQAKTYINRHRQALIFTENGNAVMAYFCDDFTVDMIGKPAKTLIQSASCSRLVENGLTKEMVVARLPELKKQMLESFDVVSNTFNGVSINNIDLGKTLQEAVSSVSQGPKNAVNSLTPEKVFTDYIVEARNPTFENLVSDDEFNSLLEQYLYLTAN